MCIAAPPPGLKRRGILIFPWTEAKRVLDDIASYAKPVVVLSGGEPLLRPDVFEIAKYGTGQGLRMCLATNGTLVTQEICDKIKDAGIKMVSLSLDGASAEVHDDFRSQPGAFAGTINAARLFKENGISFLINSSFTKRNQDEIPKIYHLAKELGATAWYMFMIVPTGRGEDIMDELIAPEDYEKLLVWHYEMEKGKRISWSGPPAPRTTTGSSASRPRRRATTSSGGPCSFPPAAPRAAWPDSLSP